MSRTDKDMPYWVRATWWEPYHFRCPHDPRWPTRRSCDLPDWPEKGAPGVRKIPRPRHPHRCYWVPVWDRDAMGPPPQWYVSKVFLHPERSRVRQDCRRARAEHRATGEVDVVPPVTQHRHAAGWSWW